MDVLWLEDSAGERLTDEFGEASAAYDALLAHVGNGRDADDIVMVGRTPRGNRSVLGSGLNLLDVAEAHAGIPAARRARDEPG